MKTLSDYIILFKPRGSKPFEVSVKEEFGLFTRERFVVLREATVFSNLRGVEVGFLSAIVCFFLSCLKKRVKVVPVKVRRSVRWKDSQHVKRAVSALKDMFAILFPLHKILKKTDVFNKLFVLPSHFLP